jgi:type III pantothenate kinase
MTWLGLVVGNSRFHWGLFQADTLRLRWDTPHCSAEQLQQLQNNGFTPETWGQVGIDYPSSAMSVEAHPPDLWAASVVEDAMAGLTTYAKLTLVERHNMPLDGLYKTLGIDRALSLLGAGRVYGWPVLVVDCGTAMTCTAGVRPYADGPGKLLGGAILPGLAMQFRALHSQTDQLPLVDHQHLPWPERWARTTDGAIASGILHTQLAGIRDFLQAWWQQYPDGEVIFTGGDGAVMVNYLSSQEPTLKTSIHLDPDLMFWGLQTYRQACIKDR